MWLLQRKSRTVWDCLPTLLLASSPIIAPSSMSMSYRKFYIWTKSPIIRVLFIQTSWKLAGPQLQILSKNRSKNFGVFSSSPSFPCTCKARALKRQRPSLSFFCFLSSKVRHFVVWFFCKWFWQCCASTTHRTSLSRAANTINFSRFLCKLRSRRCYSPLFWFQTNPLWLPQIFIAPSKCCFCLHSKNRPLPSSTNLRINPNAAFNFAAHLASRTL